MIIGRLRNIRIFGALKVLFVGTFVIILTGCGGTMQAYNGPKLQTSEVAVIKPYSPLTIICYTTKGASPIDIDKIDGKDLNFKDKCAVLPGTHKVSINMPINYGGYIGKGPEMDIVFDAEAGHVYTVYGSRIAGRAVWIVDDTTKKVVAKEG